MSSLKSRLAATEMGLGTVALVSYSKHGKIMKVTTKLQFWVNFWAPLTQRRVIQTTANKSDLPLLVPQV